MEFNSQICTTQIQSERLLALGLKKETADMFYPTISEDEHTIRACWEDFWDSHKAIDGHIRSRCTPAWSLHRLLCLTNPYLSIDPFGNIEIGGKSFSDIYEGLISTIEYNIKEGYFNKEYLEE